MNVCLHEIYPVVRNNNTDICDISTVNTAVDVQRGERKVAGNIKKIKLKKKKKTT